MCNWGFRRVFEGSSSNRRDGHVQEITRARYSPTIKFEDPITAYNDVDGYIFNINLLRVRLGFMSTCCG